MSNYTIIHDAIQEADWFQNLSEQLSDAEISRLDDESPEPVLEIASYDRPDIILLRDGIPVLVVEKTGHVPTGKNPLQRVARLVKAAEIGVTGVFFVPYAAKKHGENASKTNLNYRAIQALRNIEEINDTPMLIPPWPTDDDYELIHDGSEDQLISQFVNQFLERDCDPNVPAAEEIREQSEEGAKRILSEYAGYKTPPGSVTIKPTDSAVEQYSGLTGDGSFQMSRDETVICDFKFQTRRTDPYIGAQFAYDYLYCRTGPTILDRNRNLVLHMPKIDRETWFEFHPYKPGNKTALWYACADALVLSDDTLTDFGQFRQSEQGRLDGYR
jgi:hypothetical protein